MFGDSSKVTRKSANTRNWYTLLFDHVLPAWQNYPKRSKSFICTTNMSTAQNYAALGGNDGFQVHPVGNPIIGVCPRGDIWRSFDGVNLSKVQTIFKKLAVLCDLPTTDSLENLNNIISFLLLNCD